MLTYLNQRRQMKGYMRDPVDTTLHIGHLLDAMAILRNALAHMAALNDSNISN